MPRLIDVLADYHFGKLTEETVLKILSQPDLQLHRGISKAKKNGKVR